MKVRGEFRRPAPLLGHRPRLRVATLPKGAHLGHDCDLMDITSCEPWEGAVLCWDD